ncbi:hypothetical protein E4U17_006160 [Claviceps sp. LM77 group G4]|nr:hypothetical protein E4U17_006160 [Claviceps sp. LM77 group G4]KAG6084586.1 hypothetical protein E4U16_001483 [Claviceps sp. LM84 group G4]
MRHEMAATPDIVVDDASDADSDLEELQGDIAKFDETVREFLEAHRGGADGVSNARGMSRVRGTRGPRKAAKPRGDITARLSKVNHAFLSGDYDRALEIAFEVIRINAETHQAWTALSSIFRERGEPTRALSAMVYAAHLRPKEVPGWLSCASFALELAADDESSNLQTARACFSAALRADRTNIEARVGKAGVCYRQGHLAAAITEYEYILKHQPYNLEIIRKLAEACVDSRNAASTTLSAVTAYARYFDHLIDSCEETDSNLLWHDVGMLVELLASVENYQQAILEIKKLSRWLAGRVSETFWDEWQADDREWDEADDRRLSVPRFVAGETDVMRFGRFMPLEFRARLATYRLKLGHQQEALNHLNWLQPEEASTAAFAREFPFLVYDLGFELGRKGISLLAIKYLELLRYLPGGSDASIFLQLGRCYLDSGEQAKAEELFLAALDADEDNIDARIELANMYEKVREDEEALILAAEALALRGLQDWNGQDQSGRELRIRQASISHIPQTSRRHARKAVTKETTSSGDGPGRPTIPRRYRPKRLAAPDKRRQDEQARAIKLSHQYGVVRNLKQRIKAGESDLITVWMGSSKELIDDFRSLKKFYSWDKYLDFLGPKRLSRPDAADLPHTELSQMYERLTRSIAPNSQAEHQPNSLGLTTYQGINFDDWLDLFLEYAIGLAIANRREEAYEVCASAKDSIVFQSAKHDFTIHIAWSVCAVYTKDEERCVAIARHLMRDGVSDSFRMYALVSLLCQSPVSWYTSGPAQKYILRQIKAIDASHEHAIIGCRQNIAAERADSFGTGIDICLLMLYGHILFTSTSYTFALGYFLRARSLDPTNSMVNLSLGLAYVHYGLKRQSTNRQYLLLQGQAFLAEYSQQGSHDSGYGAAERLYNMGRLFQLLGISHLSSKYYAQALDKCKDEDAPSDLSSLISANTVISLLSVGNTEVALAVLKKNLKL